MAFNSQESSERLKAKGQTSALAGDLNTNSHASPVTKRLGDAGFRNTLGTETEATTERQYQNWDKLLADRGMKFSGLRKPGDCIEI